MSIAAAALVGKLSAAAPFYDIAKAELCVGNTIIISSSSCTPRVTGAAIRTTRKITTKSALISLCQGNWIL
ncbi:hypothetical protein DPMN_130581 [Dreissena polymorpha]|uniref:Uncharacterized protein n=1 Tax=Dreissena polymorpha TaxID=45954 RepID=A0A9D4H803_DREPO|nr:hypothetical protein DPMN_130581 [Dreissena polymorpha]